MTFVDMSILWYIALTFMCCYTCTIIGFDAHYLFDDPADCCEKWYPSRTDCPDYAAATNPEAEDEPWHSNPYSMQHYYFPAFDRNSCGYGKDYPGKHTRSSKHNQICAYDID